MLVAQAGAQPSTGARCPPSWLFNSVAVKPWCSGSLAHPFLLVSLFRVSPGAVIVHLPWVASRLHGGTSVHVAFQLSHEPLLWVVNEERLGEGAERGTPLPPGVRRPPVCSMWKGSSGEKSNTVSIACYLLLVWGKAWGRGA